MDPVIWPFIFLALSAVGIFIILALTRGGPRETTPYGVLPGAPSRRRSIADLMRTVAALYEDRGYGVLAGVGDEERGELFVEEASALTGQRIYIRCIASREDGLVHTREVRQALDRIIGEQLAKAVLVTDGEFSQEARTLALGERVELIDGAALAAMSAAAQVRRQPTEPPVARA